MTYDIGHCFCESLNDICFLLSIISSFFLLMYYRTRFKVIDLLQANKDKVSSVFWFCVLTINLSTKRVKVIWSDTIGRKKVCFDSTNCTKETYLWRLMLQYTDSAWAKCIGLFTCHVNHLASPQYIIVFFFIIRFWVPDFLSLLDPIVISEVAYNYLLIHPGDGYAPCVHALCALYMAAH